MKTLVIFQKKTGEVLHTHVQPDDPVDPREILLRFGPELKSDADIMAVEALAPATGYRVDVRTRKLVAVAGNKAPGAGGGEVRSAAGDPSAARTVVLKLGQDSKD